MKQKDETRPLIKYSDIKQWIIISGAKEHNLKNIDVSIPKNTLTIITGPSGSGKSSLALDILFAEGKRRYMESLSSYARQFLGIAKKPDVERIDGLCPAIAIEQKTVGNNPRSTIGTITEIYDYMRVLFARIGKPHCYRCLLPIAAQSPEKIGDIVLSTFINQEVTIAFPLAIEKKGSFVQELSDLIKSGYYKFIIDEKSVLLKTETDLKKLMLNKNSRHTIDVLVDYCIVSFEEQALVRASIERAFALGKGLCKIITKDKKLIYSSMSSCVGCGFSPGEIEPRLFSFNSPIGACVKCSGLGIEYIFETFFSDASDMIDLYTKICSSCNGRRLNQTALAITIAEKDIYEIGDLSIFDTRVFFSTLTLSVEEKVIAQTLLNEIIKRLTFLIDVGLPYLSLNRTARTLSGGESQRIRLATQIGAALTGVLYVLDEPSIGLHQRDNDRLIATLHALRDQGNTVVVVEHDNDTMLCADYLIDMGIGAGIHGGTVVATGTPEEISNNKRSLTGAYLSGKKNIKRVRAIKQPTNFIKLDNCCAHNLKNLSIEFPLYVLCGVSGVSGSGKSSLIMQELAMRFSHYIHKNPRYTKEKSIIGIEQIAHMVVVDQDPIGKTPRSNPATYLGIFTAIRDLFVQLPESKARGYKAGRFSFNVADGRCAECTGDGTITVSMHFLPDVVMVCPACKGKRYNMQTLEITYKDKNIADILSMTAWEARDFFKAHSSLYKRLDLLCEVGLDYIQLGQPSTTLSGGEAQRIKLVDELAKRGSNTLYILDEPTTGLHASDVEKLLYVLNKLVDKGNSMIIIEHNIDVLKTMDYIIDLGPEGGADGGTIVAQGAPEEVALIPESYTGRYLKKAFER